MGHLLFNEVYYIYIYIWMELWSVINSVGLCHPAGPSWRLPFPMRAKDRSVPNYFNLIYTKRIYTPKQEQRKEDNLICTINCLETSGIFLQLLRVPSYNIFFALIMIYSPSIDALSIQQCRLVRG